MTLHAVEAEFQKIQRTMHEPAAIYELRNAVSYAVGINQLLSNLDRFCMSFFFRFTGCANRLYELRIVRPIGCWGPDGGFKQPTRPNAACSTGDFSPIVYDLHYLLLCRIG